MAKIQVILEKYENLDEVKDVISKAWNQEVKEEDFSDREFPDPVLQDISEKLNKEFQKTYNDMFEEIMTVIRNPHLFKSKNQVIEVLEKGRKSMPVGTISGRWKKFGQGDWRSFNSIIAQNKNRKLEDIKEKKHLEEEFKNHEIVISRGGTSTKEVYFLKNKQTNEIDYVVKGKDMIVNTDIFLKEKNIINNKCSITDREVIVHDIDKIFNFEVVPPTHKIGDYSIQKHIGRWSKDYGSISAYHMNYNSLDDLKKYDPDLKEELHIGDIHKIIILHYITGQLDGHNGNTMYNVNGEIFATDNGLSMPKDLKDGFQCDVLSKFYKEDMNIDSNVIDKIKSVNINKLSNYLNNTNLDKDEKNGIIERYNNLLDIINKKGTIEPKDILELTKNILSQNTREFKFIDSANNSNKTIKTVEVKDYGKKV